MKTKFHDVAIISVPRATGIHFHLIYWQIKISLIFQIYSVIRDALSVIHFCVADRNGIF